MVDAPNREDEDAQRRLLALKARAMRLIQESVSGVGEMDERLTALLLTYRGLAHRAAADPATGLPNRTGLETALRREDAWCRRYGTPAAVVVLTVAAAGAPSAPGAGGNRGRDALLRGVAAALRTRTRGLDLIARLTEDTFAVVLPGADEAGAEALVTRLRAGLLALQLPGGEALPLRLAFGVATREETDSLATALDLAAARALVERAGPPAAVPAAADEEADDEQHPEPATPPVSAHAPTDAEPAAGHDPLVVPPAPMPAPGPSIARGRRGGLLRAALLAGSALLAILVALITGHRTEAPGPAVPSPTPTPAPAVWLARDLTGRCPPEPGMAACDPVRTALWAGDVAAWQDWAARQGEPRLTADEARGRAIAMRLAAGDPAARADLARATGQPLLVIAGVQARRDGDAVHIDAVEIVNLGSAPADLAGVTVPGFTTLGGGAALAAGQRCALGPAAAGAACPVTSPPTGPLTAAPGDHVPLRDAGGRILDDYVVP